ncbi:single-pass membrane and coiled-coil domain-containing protein 4 isoform X3 [Lutra lutra]|uniref:single-pass membrane and coiled-coil domain-containing protein 4 isoform X3 n=1 Tax=Lutra lutra TaxID=9657 RepID=UPI001FD1D036|nr:single-pass membrane and coiled-coil domain-containing protein 4 isoform X3 [Lutra lutra]XP_047548116.1 single-pass membrane and coiled-coil domain-containing protein 4 isoform X3 [Lutra lutra]
MWPQSKSADNLKRQGRTQVTFTGSQFAGSTETAVLKVEEKGSWSQQGGPGGSRSCKAGTVLVASPSCLRDLLGRSQTAQCELRLLFPLCEGLEVQCLDQRSVALSSKASPDAPSQLCPGKMRQLKGKPKKETSKDKKERKQAMQEARQQITTVVLPTLAVVVLLIVVFVYVATRPTITE